MSLIWRQETPREKGNAWVLEKRSQGCRKKRIYQVTQNYQNFEKWNLWRKLHTLSDRWTQIQHFSFCNYCYWYDIQMPLAVLRSFITHLTSSLQKRTRKIRNGFSRYFSVFLFLGFHLTVPWPLLHLVCALNFAGKTPSLGVCAGKTIIWFIVVDFDWITIGKKSGEENVCNVAKLVNYN